MSLGGSASTALDDAVRRSVTAGVTYAIAAGNSSANACNSAPGRVSQALTVGSSTNGDARSSFSNFGTSWICSRLQKWNGLSWVIVARSEGSTSVEQIAYTGTAGFYRWRVYSFQGSGSHSFWLQQP